MEFVDRTGEAATPEEIDEAIKVVSKFVVVGILSVPPELAVQLPNIRRCLIELRSTKK